MGFRPCREYPNKRQYPNRARAQKAGEWMQTQNPGDTFCPYKCDDCRAWHIGRTSNRRYLAQAQETPAQAYDRMVAEWEAAQARREAKAARRAIAREADVSRWENEGGAICPLTTKG